MSGEAGPSEATGSVSSRAGIPAPSGPSDGIARKLVRSAIFPGRTQPVHIGRFTVVALRNAAEASLELGKLRVAIGELEAAEEALRQALAGFERVLSPRNLELAVTQTALGELALARGRFDEAVMWLAGAESIFGTTAEADYPPLARARFALARARTGAARSAAPTDRALAELALAALRANARMDEARAVEVWLAEHR